MSAIRKATGRRIVLLGVLTAGLAQPVVAQDQPPSAPPAEASAEDGEIIYSRDVHHTIGAPYIPGETDTAVTAPTGAIIGTIALGLAPLTDSEGAGITASLPAAMAPLGLTEMQLAEGQGGIVGGLGQFILAETSSGSGGGAIGAAMGALSSALESLSVLSGGQP